MTPSRRFGAACLVFLLVTPACRRAAAPAPPLPADLGAYDPAVARLFSESAAAVGRSPQEGEAWARLAMAYHANDLFVLAVSCYEQALVLRQGEARWWYLLAQARERGGDADRAIEAIGEAIARDGSYPPALWRRGEWLLDRGELDPAERDFRAALALDPHDPSAAAGLARVLLERKQPDQAVPVLQALLAGAPQDAYARLLLGTALRQLGRTAEAEAELAKSGAGQRVIRNDPWSAALVAFQVSTSSRLQLAAGYLQQGEVPPALQLLERLEHERPDDPDVLTRLGQA
ncbi:MAG TPA: tetratricopeptide repeat protein, partial [Candidatus Polarisedimenticolaceae bacterium]|nr:tetratricopeptide repeat protein [Candidatus Polarisedimenticolaceae bacterium]